MRAALLTLAAALVFSGSVRAAPHNVSHSGQCLQWVTLIEHYNELQEHGGHEGHEEHEEKKHDYHEMVPECDHHGNFVPKQCHVFSEDDRWCPSRGGDCLHFEEGERWCACVDEMSGTIDMTSLTQGGEHLRCDGVVLPCMDGWTYFTEHDHGYCYKFINDKKTWAEAERSMGNQPPGTARVAHDAFTESYCEFVGKDFHGHLASIHSEETNHFLQELTLEDHKFHPSWAGANNLASPSFWMWSDGTSFEYEDWFKESWKFRPDSCLRINHREKREWSPGNCNETLPFVCAMDTVIIE